jgi:hypothetical protein
MLFEEERNDERYCRKAYQSGKKYEHDYGGCSQCVIAALQDAFDIKMMIFLYRQRD